MKYSSSNIFRFCFNFAPLRLCVPALIFFISSNAQTLAPGAPGKDAQWASAGKQAVGTSNTPESKIWFTLQGGMLTEVFYPQVDTANVNVLQFLIINGETGKIETERDDADSKVEIPFFDKVKKPRYYRESFQSLTFRQVNTAKSGQWKITKTYVTHPARNTVLIDVKFEGRGHKIYVYYDPSINNSGMHDTAWTEDGALLASEGETVSALVFSHGKNQPNQFREATNGFFGVSDGLTQLKSDKKLTFYEKAEKGNVVQVAKIPPEYNGAAYEQGLGYSGSSDYDFVLALGFGKDKKVALNQARQALFKGFEQTRAEYESGWADYVKTLPRVEAKYQAQFNIAAMVLRAFEDKTFRGGNVASLSVPWGGGNNGNETTTGYHLVWSRDLYQVATAFMALGQKDAALRALDYLFKYQQREDGSFPQISWLDGRTVGDSIQMDEISYPLILAYQLGKTDKTTYQKNVKKSAEYIVKNGPFTKQERWEEESGFSPSTIAAEIAGLVCAAEIARINGDESSAKRWLETADNWQANVEKWTATKTGKYGDGNYYLRLSQNGKPDSGEKLELGNGAGTFDEREIVDAGFLELVRFGIKPANDPLIQKSLKVVDEVLKVNTPHGEAWYRYNHDGYGDTYEGNRWNWDTTWRGNGHLWTLLSGERGQYELAVANRGQGSGIGSQQVQNPKSKIQNREFLTKAKTRLDAMLAFSNDGLMIPEQIWDRPEIPKKIDYGFIPPLRFGEGNGSATPLAWSMAQFIRLAMNLKAGRNLETPDVVFKRYVKNK
jgi:glucoamylase